jgi:hypothetical protein
MSDFLGVKFGNLATKQNGLSHKYKGLFWGKKVALCHHIMKKNKIKSPF